MPSVCFGTTSFLRSQRVDRKIRDTENGGLMDRKMCRNETFKLNKDLKMTQAANPRDRVINLRI